MIHAAGNSRVLRTMLAVVALCLDPAGRVHAGEIHSEAAVKSAFVLRIAGYVEWPKDAAAERFRIAVLGDNVMLQNLRQMADGRKVAGLPVQIDLINSVAQARGAHVLYVGAGRSTELRTLLRPMAEQTALVISAEEGALLAGSMVNFLVADGRVRFEISLDATRRSRLKVSSELLSVAARVLR